jgi:hypothetical protein
MVGFGSRVANASRFGSRIATRPSWGSRFLHGASRVLGGIGHAATVATALIPNPYTGAIAGAAFAGKGLTSMLGNQLDKKQQKTSLLHSAEREQQAGSKRGRSDGGGSSGAPNPKDFKPSRFEAE